ncbi:MAG: hypothetical protein ACLR5H_14200 [Oscillospiraceae bacterium]
MNPRQGHFRQAGRLPGRFSPGEPVYRIQSSRPAWRQEVRKVDPHAFFMVQEGVHTLGNFKRHLNP